MSEEKLKNKPKKNLKVIGIGFAWLIVPIMGLLF